MNYIILTKDEFSDMWRRQDAGDKGAAKRLLLEELTTGRQPILAIEVPFDLQLNVGEPGDETKKTIKTRVLKGDETTEEARQREADKNKTESDQSSGE